MFGRPQQYPNVHTFTSVEDVNCSRTAFSKLSLTSLSNVLSFLKNSGTDDGVLWSNLRSVVI